jgi:hypothetical protein
MGVRRKSDATNSATPVEERLKTPFRPPPDAPTPLDHTGTRAIRTADPLTSSTRLGLQQQQQQQHQQMEYNDGDILAALRRVGREPGGFDWTRARDDATPQQASAAQAWDAPSSPRAAAATPAHAHSHTPGASATPSVSSAASAAKLSQVKPKISGAPFAHHREADLRADDVSPVHVPAGPKYGSADRSLLEAPRAPSTSEKDDAGVYRRPKPSGASHGGGSGANSGTKPTDAVRRRGGSVPKRRPVGFGLIPAERAKCVGLNFHDFIPVCQVAQSGVL